MKKRILWVLSSVLVFCYPRYEYIIINGDSNMTVKKPSSKQIYSDLQSFTFYNEISLPPIQNCNFY